VFVLAWQRDGKIVLPQRCGGTRKRDEERCARGQRRVDRIDLVVQVRVYILISVPSVVSWQSRRVIHAGVPVPYPFIKLHLLLDTLRW